MPQETSLEPLEGHCPEKGFNCYNASYCRDLDRACLPFVLTDLTVYDSRLSKAVGFGSRKKHWSV